jgi:methylenetetrahydrofolate reductase (NADPH)
MRVTEMWSMLAKPTVSFELFPARSEKAAENLDRAIDTLADLRPDFVSVTFGAGGATREGSRQLVEKLKKKKGLEVLAYFAGYGLGPEDIISVLDDYVSLGVENLLVVRGDPPREESFAPHPQSFAHASDLLDFIQSRYNFCLGAAGYPEGHVEAPSKEKDIEYLKLKMDRGAEFIISNYFYETKYFFDFAERCQTAGIDIPILPGVMPVYSVKMMEMLAGLCGATITDELRRGIAALPEEDKAALVAYGIEFALRQGRELLGAGVPGLHLYTMDRSTSAVGIVNRLRGEELV